MKHTRTRLFGVRKRRRRSNTIRTNISITARDASRASGSNNENTTGHALSHSASNVGENNGDEGMHQFYDGMDLNCDALPSVSAPEESDERSRTAREWETIGRSNLGENAEWDDALAVVAVVRQQDVNHSINMLETSPRKTVDHMSSNTQSTIPLSDRMLQKLMKGKSMEALFWLVGSDGAKYSIYVRLSEAMNSYLKQLGSSKYPSYGTLLHRIDILLNSTAFIPWVEIAVKVNTNRAGVSQRYMGERRAGRTPFTKITVVMPSKWGRKDLVQ